MLGAVGSVGGEGAGSGVDASLGALATSSAFDASEVLASGVAALGTSVSGLGLSPVGGGSFGAVVLSSAFVVSEASFAVGAAVVAAGLGELVFLSVFSGRGAGFLAVSILPLENSITCP